MATILSLALLVFPQGIVIVYPGVFAFWFIMHGGIDRWRRLGTRSFWIGSVGWPPTVIPLLYFRGEIFAVKWTALPVVGILILLCALVFAVLAGREMPLRTLVGLSELQPEKDKQPLLAAGIYSRTRNPIYFVHWLLILSAAAMSGFAANWIFFAIDCVLLPLMIKAEERELAARYGEEFAAYMRRVPRFFPKLR
ncbi:MAG: isoprenylcysteine carboxylmethyltransferase family protein [Acidobacteria bacterium]|nr:isoprenylcysteine carboxylmethyltransferase family protein [Acidobacteriota bacterium]